MAIQRRGINAWSLATQIILILGFANFTALAALISIPLTPVPITGQTLAVLLAGVCLGARAGALSQVVYIGEGLLGFPVFAGGKAGLAVLIGPTGGYLVGFVLAAFVVGFLAQRGWRRRPLSLLIALILGNLAIYAVGASWLSTFVPGGFAGALASGALPFLIGDAIKIGLAAAVVPSAINLLSPIRRGT